MYFFRVCWASMVRAWAERVELMCLITFNVVETLDQ